MAIEDTFKGARNTFTFLYAYMNKVAQEIGKDKAIHLFAQVCEAAGAKQGELLRERSGSREFDARAATAEALSSIREGFGIVSEVVEEGPQGVVVRCGRCPVYEAGQAAGLDGETVESVCRSSSIRFMDSMVKQLNPDLAYQLRKFRPSPEVSCEEEVLLV